VSRLVSLVFGLMSEMTVSNVRDFIAGYTPVDEKFIRFDWNGVHAEGFVDRNLTFRKSVLDAVLADLRAAPLELTRDLYRAETQFSREAWCIDNRVSQLGEHLLRHGNDRFIEDYIEGKHQSFEASCGAYFDCDLPLAQHLLRIVRQRLQAETDAHKLELLRLAEETFHRWAFGE
jgi:hypothetical protein